MTITEIKKLAKLKKKELGVTHSQALDLIVKALGHQSWNHYIAYWNKTYGKSN